MTAPTCNEELHISWALDIISSQGRVDFNTVNPSLPAFPDSLPVERLMTRECPYSSLVLVEHGFNLVQRNKAERFWLKLGDPPLHCAGAVTASSILAYDNCNSQCSENEMRNDCMTIERLILYVYAILHAWSHCITVKPSQFPAKTLHTSLYRTRILAVVLDMLKFRQALITLSGVMCIWSSTNTFQQRKQCQNK